MLCGGTQYIAEGPANTGRAQGAAETSFEAARIRSAPAAPGPTTYAADESVQARLVADTRVRTW